MSALDRAHALLRAWGQECGLKAHHSYFCMIDVVPGPEWTLLRLADGYSLRDYRGPSGELGALLLNLTPLLVELQRAAPAIRWNTMSLMHPPPIPDAARRNTRADPVIQQLEAHLRGLLTPSLTTVLFVETLGNTYFSLSLTMEHQNVVLEVHTPSLNLSHEVDVAHAGPLLARIVPLIVEIQRAVEDRARAVPLPDDLGAQLDELTRAVTAAGTLISAAPHRDTDLQFDAYATAQGVVARLRDGRADVVVHLEDGQLTDVLLNVLHLMPDSSQFPEDYGDEYPLGDSSDALPLPPLRATPAVRAWRRDLQASLAGHDVDQQRLAGGAARLVAYHSEGEWTLTFQDGAALHRAIIPAGDTPVPTLMARSIETLTALLRAPRSPAVP